MTRGIGKIRNPNLAGIGVQNGAAQLAADLSLEPRVISVTSKISNEIRTCLLEMIENALFSDEFKNRAFQQNIVIQPSSGDDVQQFIDRVIDLMAQNEELISQILLTDQEDN